MKKISILMLSCGSLALFSNASWAANPPPSSFFTSAVVAADLPIDVASEDVTNDYLNKNRFQQTSNNTQRVTSTQNVSRTPTVAPQVDSGIDLEKLSASAKIDFQKYKNIIIAKYGNVNYSNVGADGGLGKYNIQLSTLRELGYTGTAENFLARPDLQEYAINAKIVKSYEASLQAFGNNPKKVLMGMFAYDYSGRVHVIANVTDTQQYNELPRSSVASAVQAGLKKYYGG